MFLRPMNNDQKYLFLALAEKAAEANGIIEDSEKKMLEAYADEMDIPMDPIGGLSTQEVCSKLKEISSKKELNQMAFELIGLIVSDGDYDTAEKTFMKSIIDAFGIAPEQLDKMFALVDEYYAVVKRINVLMWE